MAISINRELGIRWTDGPMNGYVNLPDSPGCRPWHPRNEYTAILALLYSDEGSIDNW